MHEIDLLRVALPTAADLAAKPWHTTDNPHRDAIRWYGTADGRNAQCPACGYLITGNAAWVDHHAMHCDKLHTLVADALAINPTRYANRSDR